MKWRSTLVLLVGVVALGLFIGLRERHLPGSATRQDQARRILTTDPQRIDHLRIMAGDSGLDCARENGVWMLRAPVAYPANAGVIERFLASLERVESAGYIDEEEMARRKLTLASYGLQSPRAVITLDGPDGIRKITLGGKSPVGGQVYAQVQGVPGVLIVPETLLDLLPPDSYALCERRLMATDIQRVRRLGLQRPEGYLQLARDADRNWVVEQPLTTAAEGQRVLNLLRELAACQILDFVGEGSESLAVYGLADPKVKASWWLEGSEKSQTLLLGNPVPEQADRFYAKWDHSPLVFTVPRSAWDTLQVKLDQLRGSNLLALTPARVSAVRITQGERSLLLQREPTGGWHMLQPATEPADPERATSLVEEWARAQIASFVDNPAEPPENYGFGPDDIRITFTQAGPAAGADETTTTVQISSRLLQNGFILARVDEGATFYQIPDAVIRTVSLDPLFYRQRRVLDLVETDIRAITLRRWDGEQGLSRPDATAPFTVTNNPTEARPDPEAVAGLLAAVTGLQAQRYVTADSRTWSGFGLEPPRAEITLGLRGAAGIARTILIGNTLPEGGAYAMIRGQDVVFVLDAADLAALTRSLWLPPAPDAPPTPTPVRPTPPGG